ncbi:RidA family protein [Insolitispirillum peregrinum]|uniref:2-iminobutanoate/2-iminopropanoate deaminase n=1 Tax=Insolitispirillum peregrinum TaxID=80876 RepID=A0A1N7NVN7_9PROT|nr:RidA family protein [Insolitispirillum peregrinum]SIT02358.1 2-iminobutanoate/2-iminopropanoate deaminase [Insolitispirillum peregrinum]
MSDLKIISTDKAPAAIGPYSQAMALGNLVFTSGQIPLKADGTLVDGGVEEQTNQVLANLKAVLEEAGASLSSVIKTTVFVQDLAHFGTINALYEAAFGTHKPARSTVQVARLPRDVLVEIEAIAVIG